MEGERWRNEKRERKIVYRGEGEEETAVIVGDVWGRKGEREEKRKEREVKGREK